MFRLFMLALIGVAAAVGLDARWDEESRDLTLHLRDRAEIVGFLRGGALEVGREVLAELSRGGEDGDPATPAVGAGRSGAEQLGDEDRKALDSLIERIRERESEGDAREGDD